MRKFEFSEFDEIGEDTLQTFGKADRFNNWMYKTILPWCKGEVLEIGSGAGNISKYFLDDNFKITLTDIRNNYCKSLENKFSDSPSLAGVIKMNLVNPDFDSQHSNLFETFDTVFALNVVEHIENDNLAIHNSKKLLKPDGHLIILVPAFDILYNKFDHGLGHYRRYTKTSVSKLLMQNNLSLIHKQYFNFAGIFGWFASGNILRNETIPVQQVNIFNNLVPVFRLVDRLLLNQAGLSTIVVGRK